MKPTDRYEQLCAAAFESAQQTLVRRANRQQAAAVVAHLITQHLGMPDGAASVIEVDGNIRGKGDGKPIGSPIELQPGDDGLWYFGVRLHFENEGVNNFSTITPYVGIEVAPTSFKVRHYTRTIHEVPELTLVALRPFLEDLYQNLLEFLAQPSLPRTPIGFITN